MVVFFFLFEVLLVGVFSGEDGGHFAFALFDELSDLLCFLWCVGFEVVFGEVVDVFVDVGVE